ncbi:MAG: RICIN domain-containing protein [Actinomycetia bacterium]|nr:RICIN domain-containing protein [Actinomycetes bacterium]
MRKRSAPRVLLAALLCLAMAALGPGAYAAPVASTTTDVTAASGGLATAPANSTSTAAAPSAKAIIDDGSVYRIVPKSNSKLSLGVSAASRLTGSAAEAKTYSNAMSQKFMAVKTATGCYAFVSIFSGHYLTVSKAKLIQAGGTAAAAANQIFKLVSSKSGVRLLNESSGYYLSVSKSGAVSLTTSAATAGGFFSFKKVGSLASGYYQLYTPDNGYLSIKGGSENSGAAALLATKSSTNALIWTVTASASGATVKLVNGKSSKSLSVKGSSAKSGTAVQQAVYSSAKGQRFAVLPVKGGWFVLKSSVGTYVSAASGKPGAAVKTTSNVNRALKFRFQTAQKPLPYDGSYIDVNLSTQRLMVIRNGRVAMQCDIVTGRPSMATPTGTWRIMSKVRHANLRGPTWNSWVSYWCQFTPSGCGFHDAYWQSSFGLARWKAGFGSHGCVNMPFASAKKFYNMVSVGDTVIVHR